MIVLGLAGPKGAGKTLIAHAIAGGMAAQGGRVLSFATPLKLMLHALLRYGGAPLDEREDMVSGSRKEAPLDILSGCTPRRAMQTLGTEWGRGLIHHSLWVDLARRRIALERAHGATLLVFDDVRFPNEVRLIEEHDGAVLVLQRAGVAFDPSHPSEAGLSGLGVVTNEGPAADVAAAVLRRVGIDTVRIDWRQA